MPPAQTREWGFTVTYADKNGQPHWSFSSHPKYESKGEALFHAYAVCRSRGFDPQGEGVSIRTRERLVFS